MSSANAAAAQQLANRAASGGPLDALLQQFEFQEAQELLNLIMSELAAGINPRQMARDIGGLMDDITYGRAETIARTETLTSWNDAALENYRANSDVVGSWMWMCMPGAGTCVGCLEEDGTIYGLDEELDDHPNGRCCKGPVTNDYGSILDSYGIDTTGLEWDAAPWENRETGAQWLLRQDAETQRQAFGSNAAYNAWKSGDAQLKDFVKIRHDPVWGDSIQQQSLRGMGLDAKDYSAGSMAERAAKEKAAHEIADARFSVEPMDGYDLHMELGREFRAFQGGMGVDVFDEAVQARLKDRVSADLGRRLTDNAAYRDLAGALNALFDRDPALKKALELADDAVIKSPKQIASVLLKAWSQGDNATFYALQEATRAEFGLADAALISGERLGSLQGDMQGLRAFVREMYNNTQDWLKANDISEIAAFRGMGWHELPSGMDAKLFDLTPHEIELELRPASSFTVDPDKAWQFSAMPSGITGGVNYSEAFAARVPAELILSTPQTGVGALFEHEAVVLGGRYDAMTIGASFESRSNLQRQAIQDLLVRSAETEAATAERALALLEETKTGALGAEAEAKAAAEPEAERVRAQRALEEAQARWEAVRGELPEHPVYVSDSGAPGAVPSQVMSFSDYAEQRRALLELWDAQALHDAALGVEERALEEPAATEAAALAVTAERAQIGSALLDRTAAERAVTVTADDAARTSLTNLVGRDLSDQEIADLVGARAADSLTAYTVGDHVQLRLMGESTPLADGSPGYSAMRSLSRDPTTGDLVMANASFNVAPELQGHGIGIEVFSEEATNLSHLGIDRITTAAVGRGLGYGGEGGYLGYYTWARFGYDGEVPWQRMFDAGLDSAVVPENLRDLTTIQEIMHAEGGLAFWKQWGIEWSGTFDLAPDSESMRVLREYQDAKAAQLEATAVGEAARTLDVGASEAAAGLREITLPQHIELVYWDDASRNAMVEVFGRPLSAGETAALVGAQDDAAVIVRGLRQHTFSLTFDYPKESRAIEIEAYDNAKRYEMARQIVVLPDGTRVMVNANIDIPRAIQGQGLGTKLFSDEVRALRANGFDRIDSPLEREGLRNGYYTWARLGYDGAIPLEKLAELGRNLPAEWSDYTRVSDLMATPEGRAWWKVNGTGFTGSFDLTSGSYSMRTLDSYLESKGMAPIEAEVAARDVEKQAAREADIRAANEARYAAENAAEEAKAARGAVSATDTGDVLALKEGEAGAGAAGNAGADALTARIDRIPADATVPDIQEWLQAELPSLAHGDFMPPDLIHVDLRSLDAQTARLVANAIANIVSEMPDVVSKVVRIIAESAPTDAWAFVSNDGRSLIINADKWADLASLAERTPQYFADGWWVSQTPEQIIGHEVGHLVQLNYKITNDTWVAAEDRVLAAGGNPFVSEYAKNKTEESFAETFSLLVYGEPTEAQLAIAREMADLLRGNGIDYNTLRAAVGESPLDYVPAARGTTAQVEPLPSTPARSDLSILTPPPKGEAEALRQEAIARDLDAQAAQAHAEWLAIASDSEYTWISPEANAKAVEEHQFQRQAEAARAKADYARGEINATVHIDAQRQEVADRLFGRDMSMDDLKRLSGAQRGDQVYFASSPAGKVLKVITQGSGRYNEFRVRSVRGELIMHHDLLRISGDASGVTSGASILRGLADLRDLGVARIETLAAQGDTFNGYYTWARLGFQGDIPMWRLTQSLRADLQAQFPGVTRVEQLMALRGGPQWWKAYGVSWDATLDLNSGAGAALLDRLFGDITGGDMP